MRKDILYLGMLCIIFLAALFIRINIALETDTFSDDKAYFALRQIESIKDTGLPIYEDSLSYGGREHVFVPLFYYLLAIFALFFDTVLVAKVLPNIFAASIVFVVYLMISHMTKDKEVAVLTAFVSGFIPVFFEITINSVSVYSLAVPLGLLMFYSVLENRFWLFLISLIALMLSSPSAIIFVLALILYLIFSWVEGFKPARSEVELTLFSLFLVVSVYFLIFRDALLAHGLDIVRQNIPSEMISFYFSEIDLVDALYRIGIVPAIAGTWALYYYIRRKRMKPAYLIISLLIIDGLLLMFQLIELRIGLLFLGAGLSVLFGQSFLLFIAYIKRTKFARFSTAVIAAFFALFVLTSVMPSIQLAEAEQEKSLPVSKVIAYTILGNSTSPGSVFVTTVFEGHQVNYYTGKKAFADTSFLLIPDASERLRDLRTMYTSAIEPKPLSLMREYGTDYIILSDRAESYYNISKISYVTDECFPLIYSGKDLKVYERRCG